MKTLKYSTELYADIMSHTADYFQTSETVCGAQHPAVIEVNLELGQKYPEVAGLNMVRVVNQYLNPWESETLLHFSTEPITDAEYAQYEDMVDQLD